MKNTYNAYFQMMKLKTMYKRKQSYARATHDKQTADEYGDRVTVVEKCMDILNKECNLKFEQ